MLGCLDLFDRKQCLAFLHKQMQFGLVGGFGKHVGDKPDIYHSFLGLAASALLNPDGPLHPVDSALATSQKTTDTIAMARNSAFSGGLAPPGTNVA